LPADADLDLGLVGLGGERHVGDQRAQQAFAVAVGSGWRCPEARQVTGERFDVGARGQRRFGGLAGEFGLGLLQLAQLGLPA
jgi:hypothetical protein